MEYVNGFAKNDFLQYMYQEFPRVYSNSHSRELLENLVDYCIEEVEFEGRLIDTLENLIPEITHNEITRYFDNRPKEKIIISSIDELKQAIEDYGWNISECSFGDGDTGWELYKFSPAGEDFGFSVCHNNDIDTAIKEISDYAYNFDTEEHIKLWIEAKDNVSGVPSIRELVKDADAIQEMLDELSDFCSDLEKEYEYEMGE